LGLKLSEDQLQQILDRLDMVRLELLKLRALLLEEEELTEEETKELQEAIKETGKGKSVSFEEFLKELD
jgi:hypothetical protein